MPAELTALQIPWVQELLCQPLLARLGTANPRTSQPHVTPVWFEWDGQRLYISAFISTRKAREAVANPLISVCIDVADSSRGVLLEGRAEIWSDPLQVAQRAKSIYTRYVGAEKIEQPTYQSWIVDPENRIICLLPRRVYAWGD